MSCEKEFSVQIWERKIEEQWKRCPIQLRRKLHFNKKMSDKYWLLLVEMGKKNSMKTYLTRNEWKIKSARDTFEIVLK